MRDWYIQLNNSKEPGRIVLRNSSCALPNAELVLEGEFPSYAAKLHYAEQLVEILNRGMQQ